MLRLAAAVAIAGAAAFTSTASAHHDFCVPPQSYMEICFPTDQPGCLFYGYLGAEANVQLGYCERWHG